TGTALAAAHISGSAGEVASNLGAGSYALKVIENATGCSTIRLLSIVEDQVLPIVTAIATDNTVCDTNIATSGAYNGSIAASVQLRGAAITDFTNYSFTWYAGNSISAPTINLENAKDID